MQQQPTQEGITASIPPPPNSKASRIALILFLFWNLSLIKVVIPTAAIFLAMTGEWLSIAFGLGLPAIFLISAVTAMWKSKKLNFWNIALRCEQDRESSFVKIFFPIYLSIYLVGGFVYWCLFRHDDAPLGEPGNLWSVIVSGYTAWTVFFAIHTYDGAYSSRKKGSDLIIGHPKTTLTQAEQEALVKINVPKVDYSSRWHYLLLWPLTLLHKMLMFEEEWAWWYDSEALFATLRLIISLKYLHEGVPLNDLKAMPRYSDVDWEIMEDLTDEEFLLVEKILLGGKTGTIV